MPVKPVVPPVDVPAEEDFGALLEEAFSEDEAAESAAAGTTPVVKDPVEAPLPEEVVAPVAAPAATPVADPAADPAAAPTAVTAPVAAPAAAPAAVTPEEEFKLEEFAMTDKQKAAIAKFIEINPEAAEALEVHLSQIRHESKNQLIVALANVLNVVGEQVNPLRERSDVQVYNDHMGYLHSQHADYDKVIDQVDAWIKTVKADYLQESYRKVYASGNAAQVSDLVTRWKTETGYKPVDEAAAPAAAGKKKPAAAAAPAATEAEIAALAPVRTQAARVSPTSGDGDPNDYDGEFDKAVAEDS